MRHNLIIKCFAFSFRPVELADVELIVQMRTTDPERVRYLHPISPDIQLQRDWIAEYLDRNNDYYWVIERSDTHEPEGLIGIYNMDTLAKTAEWGRWVLKPGSLAAIESIIMLYRAAFEFLKLKFIYCLTVAENMPAVSFHDSCGLPRADLLKNYFMLRERQFDAIKHTCSLDIWPEVRRRLEPKAEAIAKKIANPV